MQTHFPLQKLELPNDDDDIHALFAVRPDRKAIVFIHGYSGSALTTWADFHELLPECAKCSNHDLYFYGYDGLYSDLIASAAVFRALLAKIFSGTAAFVNANVPASAQRPGNFSYDEMITDPF